MNSQEIVDAIINLKKNNIYDVIANSISGDTEKMDLLMVECNEQIDAGHRRTMVEIFDEDIVRNIEQWKKANS